MHHQQHNTHRPQQQQHSMRILNSQDTDSLLSNFPTTRLSYEASIHKNDKPSIASEYKCFILPKGRRCIAWATEWKRNKIFAVIDIDGANNRDRDRDRDRDRGQERTISPIIRKFHQDNGWFPGKVRIYDVCFDRSLVYGTVFGGVLFRMNDEHMSHTQFFSIHTIYWYKGNPVPSLTAGGHIQLCEDMFREHDIRQVAYTKQNSVIFGLPILCNTEQDAENIARGLPYETFAIQYRYFTHTRVFQRILQEKPMTSARAPGYQQPVVANIQAPAPAPMHVHEPVPVPAPTSKRLFIPPPDEMLTNIQATFIVRPNIQNDIYELFVLPSSSSSSRGGRCEPLFHNFAHISGFKTSVMMNRLFRNITENERLDTMEESEDEVEFENTEPDKYVTLTKEYIMVCRFNKRFCRWVPIEVVTRGDIITEQQVKQHEIRYLNYRRK